MTFRSFLGKIKRRLRVLLKLSLDIPLINRKAGMCVKIITFLYMIFLQPFKLRTNEKNKFRCLEIGPGETRIEGFETLNVVLRKNIDYIGKLGGGGGSMPFKDNSFDIVYMSHVLEHIFWHKMDKTIAEIKRIIKTGGTLEIWVPDAVKIAQAFLDAENGVNEDFKTKDGWFRFNEQQDPCIWFSGRTFTYGDGVSATAANHWNIHLAWFSERYLKKLLHENGFTKITRMDNAECRAYDHGFINLGIKAVKANNIL